MHSSVSAADVGNDIQVIASYTDNGSHPESPVSASKTIQQIGEGDLLVTLIQIKSPLGASISNPLTTLVQDAIDFGLTPNTAMFAIKTVLGLPDGIDLQTYDAYGVLQLNPSDPTALAVEKIAVEVAILTSLSDDDTGTNLTFRILNAAENNQTLDLADANDLADILGVDITGITDKNDYPEPLREIFDRHENIAQATDVADIEVEWQDFLSIQDNVDSTSIADLSIHVNQAPEGLAAASLVDGVEDTAYIVSASDLLQGFSDPDGDTLSVLGLSADNGSVVDNGNGTFTITPVLNFNGPVELTYTVSDGQGGNTPANQLFVISPGTPDNAAPIGTATAALAAGTEDVAYTVSASDLLQGFSDPDGDTLSVSGLSASNGAVVNNGDGSFTITPALNFNGVVNLSYNVTDGAASIAASQSYNLAAAENSPPVITSSSSFALSENKTLVGTITAADPENGTITFALTGGADRSFFTINDSTGVLRFLAAPDYETPEDANQDGIYEVAVSATDVSGASSAQTVNAIVLNVGEPATTINGGNGNDTITGSPGNDTINAANGNDTVNGGDGNDAINGGNGNDTLSGGRGNDVLNGNNGGDTLYAGGGVNELSGGNGNDTLYAQNGNNLLNGGNGSDKFVFGPGFALNVIADFGSSDHVEFDDVFANFLAVQTASQQVGLNTVIALDANHSITLTGVAIGSLGASDFLFT